MEVYGEHVLAERSERDKSGLHDLKIVILGWKTKNVLGSQKSLKMKNWKHYSMKIVAKHKKSSQSLWELLKQLFQNVWNQLDTFQSKEIRFHTN